MAVISLFLNGSTFVQGVSLLGEKEEGCSVFASQADEKQSRQRQEMTTTTETNAEALQQAMACGQSDKLCVVRFGMLSHSG